MSTQEKWAIDRNTDLNIASGYAWHKSLHHRTQPLRGRSFAFVRKNNVFMTHPHVINPTTPARRASTKVHKPCKVAKSPHNVGTYLICFESMRSIFEQKNTDSSDLCPTCRHLTYDKSPHSLHISKRSKHQELVYFDKFLFLGTEKNVIQWGWMNRDTQKPLERGIIKIGALGSNKFRTFNWQWVLPKIPRRLKFRQTQEFRKKLSLGGGVRHPRRRLAAHLGAEVGALEAPGWCTPPPPFENSKISQLWTLKLETLNSEISQMQSRLTNFLSLTYLCSNWLKP